MKQATLFALLIVWSLAGCSNLPEITPLPCELDVSLTDDGWLLYTTHDYRGALSRFDEALRQGCSTTDAYNGKGWVYARMDSLSQAQVQFTLSIEKNLSVVDAFAGRAAVNLELGNYERAIKDAESVLSLKANYVFVRDITVTAWDVHLIIAQASYHLAVTEKDPRKAKEYYRKAQEKVDLLKPDNGLDPEKSATWKVGKRTFGSYEEALLLAIEALDTSIKASKVNFFLDKATILL